MNLKPIVPILGAVALSCLTFECSVQATGNSSARASVGSLVTLRKAYLKFVTTNPVVQEKDLIMLTVLGVDVTPGDTIELLVDSDGTVPVLGSGLTMQGNPGGRLTGKGVLGSPPFDFDRCKAIYLPRSKKLKITCARGASPEFPVFLSSGGGVFEFPYPIRVTVFIGGQPIVFDGIYNVKFKNKKSGPMAEKDTLAAPVTTVP